MTEPNLTPERSQLSNPENQGGLQVELGVETPEVGPIDEIVDRQAIAEQEAQKENGLQVQIETISPTPEQFPTPVFGKAIVKPEAVIDPAMMVALTVGTHQLLGAALEAVVGQLVAQRVQPVQPEKKNNVVLLNQPTTIKQISDHEQPDIAA